MDLATLDVTSAANAGATLTLRHPVTGDDLPMTITLAGKDSATWKEAERKYADKRLAQMQRNGKMGNITTAEVEKRGLKLLAAVTLDWTGIELDEKPVACTKENAEHIYAKFAWIAEQVDEFVGDRSNFLPDTSKTPVERLIGDTEAAEASSVFSADAHLANIAKN